MQAGRDLAAALGAKEGHEPRFEACDLRDVDALKAGIDRVGAELGPVTALVNNAGNDDRHTLDSVTSKYFDD